MRSEFSKKRLAVFVTLLLGLAPAALAAEKSWNKVRYEGGTIQVKVNPFDWNTTLKISGSSLEIGFNGLNSVSVDLRTITSLSHGEKAYHRVSDLLLANPASRPAPLFGILQAGKDHLVGIEFRNRDGSSGAVLLFVRRDSYDELLRALSAASGKPIED